MNLPKLHLPNALSFFRSFMYIPLQGKRTVYEARNIRLGSAVTPSDWEVFASLLLDRKGNGGISGVDLGSVEVKSAFTGGSYEYQYHKETGKQKLRADMKVGHLFINHSDFLNHVEVWYVHGSKAKKEYFSKWLKNYPNPYPQRYRHSISYGWVKKHGDLLLTLVRGKEV